jgi:hypothetical protein
MSSALGAPKGEILDFVLIERVLRSSDANHRRRQLAALDHLADGAHGALQSLRDVGDQ